MFYKLKTGRILSPPWNRIYLHHLAWNDSETWKTTATEAWNRSLISRSRCELKWKMAHSVLRHAVIMVLKQDSHPRISKNQKNDGRLLCLSQRFHFFQVELFSDGDKRQYCKPHCKETEFIHFTQRGSEKPKVGSRHIWLEVCVGAQFTSFDPTFSSGLAVRRRFELCDCVDRAVKQSRYRKRVGLLWVRCKRLILRGKWSFVCYSGGELIFRGRWTE